MRIISRSVAAVVVLLIVSTFLIVHAAPSAVASDSDSLLPEYSAPMAAKSGKVKVTLVTLRTPDKSAAATAAINLGSAKNAVTYANNYWKSLSNSRLSISLSRTITGFKTKARTSDDGSSILKTVAKELKWTSAQNSVLVIFIPRSDIIVKGRSGYQGLGGPSFNGGGQILMPYASLMTNQNFAHEIGHVFGMRHANSLQCKNGAQDARIINVKFAISSCTSVEYGDNSDVMGSPKYTTQYLNSVLFEHAGMGNGNEIRNIGYPDGTKSYTLKPWAGTGAHRAIKYTDPISKEVYYIQLRLPVGYDKYNATSADQGVQILKSDIYDGGSLLLQPKALPWRSAWVSGNTFTSATGFKIKVNYISKSAAGITITGGSLYKLAPTMDATAAKHKLGSPVGSIVGYLKGNGAYRKYQNGFVYYSPKKGTVVSKGNIGKAYQKAGLHDSSLGFPKANEVTGLKGGGVSQEYEGGRIIWTAKTGAHSVAGVIGKKWDEVGAHNGRLGYPVSGLTTDNTESITQNFQGGKIVWTVRSGATVFLNSVVRKTKFSS